MSDKSVKTERKNIFLKKSSIVSYISVVLGVIVLEIVAIFGAVSIIESKNQKHNDILLSLTNEVSSQSSRIESLQKLSKLITNNANKIAENTNYIRLNETNLNALKSEVGNKRVDVIAQQLNDINHRIETVEESKSTEALVLSLALIIKENAMYNRSFAQEAEILNTLSSGQEIIANSVKTINDLKNTAIESDITLIDEFITIAVDFSFNKQDTKNIVKNPTESNTMSKSIKMIKDTVANINLDKVVILKKDKKTEEEKLLLATLKDLVIKHNFSDAIDFIKGNSKFSDVENEKLANWIKKAQQKVTFDKAISFIISSELNALRKDFNVMANKEATID